MRFVSHQFYTSAPLRLPVAGGGWLDVATQQFVPYRWAFAVSPGGGEVDDLLSVVALTDSAGRVYRGISALKPTDILKQMGSFTALDPLLSVPAEALQAEMAPESTFFRDARCLLDDRETHVVAIDGSVWLVPFHYQTPRVALGFTANEAAGILFLHGIVSGLTGFRIESPDVTDEDLEEMGEEDLPVVKFSVDLEPHRFVSWYDRESKGNLVEAPAARPVVFSLIAGESAEPNPLIVFSE